MAQPQPQSRLLNLPYDIRILIFEYAVTFPTTYPNDINLTWHSFNWEPIKLDPVLKVRWALRFRGACRQIRNETKGLLFTQNKVRIHLQLPTARQRPVLLPQILRNIPEALSPPYLRVCFQLSRGGDAYLSHFWGMVRDALVALEEGVAPLRKPEVVLLWDFDPMPYCECQSAEARKDRFPLKVIVPITSSREERRALFGSSRLETSHKLKVAAVQPQALGCPLHGDAEYFIERIAKQVESVHKVLDGMPDDLVTVRGG